MKPNEIKAEIIRNGLSYTEIAAEAGRSVQQVSMCVRGDGLYQKIREIIARRLKQKVDDVFAADHPKRKVRGVNPTE